MFSLTRVLISKNGILWSEMPRLISMRLTISGRFVKNRSSTDDVVDVVCVGLSTIWDTLIVMCHVNQLVTKCCVLTIWY